MNMRNDDYRGFDGNSPEGASQEGPGRAEPVQGGPNFGETGQPDAGAGSAGPYSDSTGPYSGAGAQAYETGSYSQGWNQPRGGAEGDDPRTLGSLGPYPNGPQTQSFNGQGQEGPMVTPLPPQPEQKKKIGLGAATALAAVAAIAAGSIAGAVVGMSSGGGNNDTSVVNEALKAEPANNSTGKEPEQGSVEEVASKVLPAVVSIQTMTRTGGAEGSGSVISPDGYVLTNHHVVAGAEHGGMMQVTMNDGSKHEADVVASDANTDVAIVKIKDVKDLPFLQFGDSDSVAVGQEVVAVGSPLGLNATVTSGIVSAKNRPVRASQEGGESSLIDAIQTDAAVNPGNSGGPLVDRDGNIVGMNSMIASLSNNSSGEGGSIGLGFAIPSNFAKRMADELINDGKVSHPTLGVKVLARDDGNGARIAEVEPGGPADKAGLKDGDIVTRVNDRLIENADALIAAARSQGFGATVTLEVTREDSDESRQVEVTLSGE